jgi:hypothetical protein
MKRFTLIFSLFLLTGLACSDTLLAASKKRKQREKSKVEIGLETTQSSSKSQKQESATEQLRASADQRRRNRPQPLAPAQVETNLSSSSSSSSSKQEVKELPITLTLKFNSLVASKDQQLQCFTNMKEVYDAYMNENEYRSSAWQRQCNEKTIQKVSDLIKEHNQICFTTKFESPLSDEKNIGKYKNFLARELGKPSSLSCLYHLR